MSRRPTVTGKMIMQLIEHQQFRCALSNRELTPETASLDHIVPLSRGGTHDISNLCVLDHRVNSAKGTMTVEEFVALCSDVAAHGAHFLVHDAQTRYLEKPENVENRGGNSRKAGQTLLFPSE